MIEPVATHPWRASAIDQFTPHRLLMVTDTLWTHVRSRDVDLSVRYVVSIKRHTAGINSAHIYRKTNNHQQLDQLYVKTLNSFIYQLFFIELNVKVYILFDCPENGKKSRYRKASVTLNDLLYSYLTTIKTVSR